MGSAYLPFAANTPFLCFLRSIDLDLDIDLEEDIQLPSIIVQKLAKRYHHYI